MLPDIDAIPPLVNSGNWKRVFAIVKRHSFKLSKAELREIELGLEFLNGRAYFYNQLGVNCQKSFETAKSLVRARYLRNS